MITEPKIKSSIMFELDGELVAPEDMFVVIGDIWHVDGKCDPAGGLIGPNLNKMPPKLGSILTSMTYISRFKLIEHLHFTPEQLRTYADILENDWRKHEDIG